MYTMTLSKVTRPLIILPKVTCIPYVTWSHFVHNWCLMIIFLQTSALFSMYYKLVDLEGKLFDNTVK